ncbi:caM kinase-like vesicle-associated protein [Lates japonicus]|uniref:CaM kinase-like vesicle-associated protein n=1 Tax=Lates japonicus TaxID=270547 RepID=A0AAD3RIE2_LATJO|nr:caM kinase-like vesicle-associated protein [Lates japonicus]
MSPSQRGRYGCEAARNAKWRLAAPPNIPLLKRPGGIPQPWPIHPHPTGQVHRSHFLPPPPPPPQLPLFHTRHAEESAERPHLVTIIRPCGQTTLRKVAVLLNMKCGVTDNCCGYLGRWVSCWSVCACTMQLAVGLKPR